MVDDRKVERNLNPIAAERVDTSVCIVPDDIGDGSSTSSTQGVYSLSEDGCFRRTADEVHTGSSVLSVLNGICPQKASMHHPNDGLIDSLRQPSRIKENEHVEVVADERRFLLFLLRTKTVALSTLSHQLVKRIAEIPRRTRTSHIRMAKSEDLEVEKPVDEADIYYCEDRGEDSEYEEARDIDPSEPCPGLLQQTLWRSLNRQLLCTASATTLTSQLCTIRAHEYCCTYCVRSSASFRSTRSFSPTYIDF